MFSPRLASPLIFVVYLVGTLLKMLTMRLRAIPVLFTQTSRSVKQIVRPQCSHIARRSILHTVLPRCDVPARGIAPSTALSHASSSRSYAPPTFSLVIIAEYRPPPSGH
jgi:hypothetical protein